MSRKRIKCEIRTCLAPDCSETFEVRYYKEKKYCCRGHRQHKLDCNCCICKNKRHEPKSEEHKRKIGLGMLGKNKTRPKPLGFSATMSKATSRCWKNPEYAKMMIKSWHRKPNKPEKQLNYFLQEILPGEYQINVNAEVMTLAGKCPDFVSINGQKKIIEMNGDWWHGEERTGRTKKEEEQQRIDIFAKEGYQTLIIWQHELEDYDSLVEKITNFHKL